MKALDWRTMGRTELAALLEGTRCVSSQAVGAATVYRVEQDGRELLAIALPGGEVIAVSQAAPVKQRRRIDAKIVTPASR